MNKYRLQEVIYYVDRRLLGWLDRRLLYHNRVHTIWDVLPASIRIAKWEMVNGPELELLKVAALFHDTGFTMRYENNEEIAVEIAGEILPLYTYSLGEIQRIQQLIMSTKLTKKGDYRFQEPDINDISQLILCDADLDSLGRTDYFLTSHNLRIELELQWKNLPIINWYQDQKIFLETHRYFTRFWKRFREQRKKLNIEQLQLLIR